MEKEDMGDAVPATESKGVGMEDGGVRVGRAGPIKRIEERERAYWQRAVDTIGPTGVRIWKVRGSNTKVVLLVVGTLALEPRSNALAVVYSTVQALEKSLERYLSMLQKRSNTLEELKALQVQNEELRLLLNQYLSSRINEELRIPPTAVM